MDFFLWRAEFFKIGKRDFMVIREMRVSKMTILDAPICITQVLTNSAHIAIINAFCFQILSVLLDQKVDQFTSQKWWVDL